MHFSEFIYLIQWDLRINCGWSWDSLRAKLFLVELRIEQFIFQQIGNGSFAFIWYFVRFLGSIFQWFMCNSNIPGTTTIGRGLRLPHPQNIIVAGFTDIGEFCTIYHNVSIAWNGFIRTKPYSPKIGDKVLIGAGSILIGDITIGKDVLIAAGSILANSVPEHSRVTCVKAEVTPRMPSELAADPGSRQHIQDPYSIWR